MPRQAWITAILLASLFSAILLHAVQLPRLAAPPVDCWPMFRRDMLHTGYTANAGPTKPIKLWSHPEGHFTGYFIESSPAVVNGIVYIGSNWNHAESRGGNIYAFNAFTGKEIWNYSTQWAVHSSPAISENMLLIGADNYVLALNALTGAKIWSFETGRRVDSSPVVAKGAVYIGSQDCNVYALNVTTGAKIWNYTTQGEVNSSPAVANGVIYVGSDDNNVYALNASTGTTMWVFTTRRDVKSSPALDNGMVYVGSGDGNVYALDALTGEKAWSFDTIHLSQNPGIVASPAVASGVVYIPSDGGGLFALNASTGVQIWNKFRDYAIEHSSPAVANGVVYISTLAINASTGSAIWAFRTGNVIYSSPAVADEVVYVGSTDGNFYAIGEPSPPGSAVSIQTVIIVASVSAIIAISAIALATNRREKKKANDGVNTKPDKFDSTTNRTNCLLARHRCFGIVQSNR